MKIFKTTLFLAVFFMPFHALNAAEFTCLQSGVWYSASTWTVTSGLDIDGIPDANDFVRIVDKTVTLNDDVVCSDITLVGGNIDAVDVYNITAKNMYLYKSMIGTMGSLVYNVKNITLKGLLSANGTISSYEGGTIIASEIFYTFVEGLIGPYPVSFTLYNCTLTTTSNLRGGQDSKIYLAESSILRVNTTVPPITVGITPEIVADNIAPQGGLGILEINVNNFIIIESCNWRCPVVINGSIIVPNGKTLGLSTDPIYPIMGSGKIILEPTGVLNSSAGLDDLVLNGVSLENNSTLNSLPIKFKGTTPQTLSGTGTVNNVIVDNPSGVTIEGSPTINTLNLINGGLVLNNADVRVGNILGFGTTRYIKTLGTGRLVKSVNPGLNSNWFPVGTSTYAPINLANTNSGNLFFNYAVNVRDGINPTRPLSGTAGTSFINKEWNISPTAGSTALNVYLEWKNSDVNAGFNCNTASMLHHNGTTWDVLPESNTLRGCAFNAMVVSNVTNFSPFAIGQANVVLSADLISIKAAPQYKSILINWQTANEQNMLDFGVERSMDGQNFEQIGSVKANNVPSIYDFKDATAQGNTLYYYRIAQRENSGKTEYSKVVTATLSGKNKTVSVFPNPAKDVLNISGIEPSDEWQVVDIIGKIRATYKGQQTLDVSNFSNGIYFIKMGAENVSRFVVTK